MSSGGAGDEKRALGNVQGRRSRGRFKIRWKMCMAADKMALDMNVQERIRGRKTHDEMERQQSNKGVGRMVLISVWNVMETGGRASSDTQISS